MLFKEARRRRHRIRAVSAATIVAVAAAVLGVGLYLSQPASPGAYPSGSRLAPVSHPRTGATLVYSLNNLRVIDADTGASRTLRLPAPAGGASDRAMVRIGGSLLLNRGDRAWLYRPELLGAPVDLGPSLRIIPGPAPGEVWLWTDPCAEAPAGAPGCSGAENDYGQGEVQLVDFSGHPIGAPIPLPLGPPPAGAPLGTPGTAWFPTGDVVDTGLVLAPIYGARHWEVWDPTANRVIRTLPPGGVIAAGGNLVASVAGGSCLPKCTLRLVNVRTGIERNVTLPIGAVSIDEGSFSPNGATLAVPVGLGGAWPGRHPTALVLVDLRTKAAGLLPGSEQKPTPNYGAFNATWSNTGWLFYTAYGSTRILVWHPGEHKAQVLSRARLPRLSPELAPEGQQLPTLIAL